MALESQGCVIYWSTTTSLSTAQSVGQVTGFNGPSGAASIIDVTNLGSTAKEKLMGLPDEGQISIDFTYQSTDTGQAALRTDRSSRTKRRVAIKFTDSSSSIVHGEAYVTNFSVTGAVDDAIKGTATFELTGPLTWTTQ